MVIDIEKLESLEGEFTKKIQYVFLESEYQPTSRTGADIPEGILYLTSRRLFFFNYKYGSPFLTVRPHIAKNLVSKMLFGNIVENTIAKDMSELSQIQIPSSYTFRSRCLKLNS